MIIKKYDESDNIEEILKLDNQAVEDFLDKIEAKNRQVDLLDINKYYCKKNGEFFVGKVEGKIVCTCGYVPNGSNTVELKRLRVIKNLRGSGYGSFMLNYIEKDIRSKGFSIIEFTTASSRETTISFYKNRGYKDVGKSKYDRLDTIDFKKELN